MVDIDANLTNTRGRPRDAILAAVVNPDGTLIGGGGAASQTLLEAIRDNQLTIIDLLEQIRDNTAST